MSPGRPVPMSPRRRRRMPEPPRFVVVAGPPCAGKSSLARRLSSVLDAPHLQMDQFRLRAIPDSDLRVEHRDIAYRAMHLAAELMAARCGALVLDATYTARRCRADLAGVVRRAGASLFVVECHAAAATAVERFLRRGAHPAADLTGARVAALAAAYPYYDGAYGLTWGRNVDRELASVVRHVQGAPMTPRQIDGWRRRGQPRVASEGAAGGPAPRAGARAAAVAVTAGPEVV